MNTISLTALPCERWLKMGNGASSRPVNPVHATAIMSRNEIDFQQTGYSTSSSAGFRANGIESGQPFQPYTSSTYYPENYDFRNRWLSYDPHTGDGGSDGYYGVDEFIETSAGPHSGLSYSQLNYSSQHESALSQHSHRNNTRTHQQERSVKVPRVEAPPEPTSSEGIVFEVFHSDSEGDFTVVNIDGVRYFLSSDSWTTGDKYFVVYS